MANGNDFSFNLALPVVPDVKHPHELFEELTRIYTAIKILAVQLDSYTKEGQSGEEYEIATAQVSAQVTQLTEAVSQLSVQLELINFNVNWGQPGELGAVNPNAVTASTLAVTGDTSLAAKFGANGSAPSAKIALPIAAVDAATTQALVNAIRTLLITFGLGS